MSKTEWAVCDNVYGVSYISNGDSTFFDKSFFMLVK